MAAIEQHVNVADPVDHSRGPDAKTETLWHEIRRVCRYGLGALPATRAGAEQATAFVLVSCRIVILGHILIGSTLGFSRSPAPLLYIGLLGFVVLESVALCTYAMRRRQYNSLGWVTFEAFMIIGLLISEPVFATALDFPMGSWIGWVHPFASNVVASIALGCRNRTHLFILVGLIIATEIGIAIVEPGRPLAAALTTSVVYLLFAVVVRGVTGYVRRFGADVDAARQDAIEAAQLAEVERHRRLLHDTTTLLRNLAEPSLDQGLADVLRKQALEQSNRINAFLAGRDTNLRVTEDADGMVQLTAVVSVAAANFTDLPIEIITRLATGVRLATEAGDAVTEAIATVLHNVRRHAGPVAKVVLHGDSDPELGTWEISIRDDGVGFDQESTPRGFGLSSQVEAALAAHRIDCDVQSQVGEGTVVVLRGTTE